MVARGKRQRERGFGFKVRHSQEKPLSVKTTGSTAATKIAVKPRQSCTPHSSKALSCVCLSAKKLSAHLIDAVADVTGNDQVRASRLIKHTREHEHKSSRTLRGPQHNGAPQVVLGLRTRSNSYISRPNRSTAHKVTQVLKAPAIHLLWNGLHKRHVCGKVYVEVRRCQQPRAAKYRHRRRQR